MGKLGLEFCDEGLRGGIDVGAGGGFGPGGAGDGEVGFAGDADFAADEPGDVRGEGGLGCCGMEGGGDVHGDGEDDFVLVAEVHERAERETFGRRELERVGGDAGGEVPFCGGRLAGVAGVDPVDVPAFFQFEVEAGGEGFAGCELGGRDEERDGEVLRGDGGLRVQGWCEREDECEGEREERESVGAPGHGDWS